jgi:hypothetical protein
MKHTRIGMIVLGLALWALAIAWPSWQMPIMLVGGAMVMFAVLSGNGGVGRNLRNARPGTGFGPVEGGAPAGIEPAHAV